MESEKLLLSKLIFDIKGWLTFDEGYVLYCLAKETKLDIMEIGAYCGRSTVCLCAGSEAGFNQVVWTIDRFDSLNVPTEEGNSTHKEFWDNICVRNVERKLRVIVDDTRSKMMHEQAKTFELGMLFHDGGHEYNDVKHDLDLFLPQVITGGYVCVHDFNPGFPGVVEAISERKDIKNLGLISSNMWVGQKC